MYAFTLSGAVAWLGISFDAEMRCPMVSMVDVPLGKRNQTRPNTKTQPEFPVRCTSMFPVWSYLVLTFLVPEFWFSSFVRVCEFSLSFSYASLTVQTWIFQRPLGPLPGFDRYPCVLPRRPLSYGVCDTKGGGCFGVSVCVYDRLRECILLSSCVCARVIVYVSLSFDRYLVYVAAPTVVVPCV